MPLSKQLFRESALERLTSPEQLDQVLQITSPRGWLALAATWAVLAVVVVWSFFGSVLTKEVAPGIIVAGGGLKLVVAPGSGRLDSILVGVDDRVVRDQVVAVIDKHDIEDLLDEAAARLAELRSQNTALEEFDVREQALEAELADAEIARLQETIRFDASRISRLQERRAIVDELVRDGSMTAIDLHRVDEEVEGAQQNRQKAALRIESVRADTATATLRRERERLQRRLATEELAGRVRSLEARLDRESKVRAGFGGRVVEIRVAEQTAVVVGEPILVVEPEGASELEAYLYVSAVTGKVIRPGMAAELSPSTVKREEHGSLRGTVLSIADVPTSKSAMLARLSGDRDLVDRFVREVGLPLEMRVSLRTDPETPSGYEWTTDLGPPARLSAGTLCSGSVTVDRQRPISLVLPMLRRAGRAE